MTYLVDTNVLSELRRPDGSTRVREALASIPLDAMSVSVITLGEIAKGLVRLSPGRRRTDLADWLDGIEHRFGQRALVVDGPIAREWGELTTRMSLRGRMLHAPDGLIAATARIHDLTLLTRNTANFTDTGVRVLDPWTTPIA